MKDVLIEAKDIQMYFPIKQGVIKRTVGHIKAVDGISLKIYEGESLGIVGESGSGKSTLGRILLQLQNQTNGDVFYKGEKISGISNRKLRPFRRDMQMVFQDPYASLNPRMSIGELIEEPLLVHKTVATKAERKKRAEELLETVGLPKQSYDKYPHEFSGGQRQRIGIARALSTKPSLIIGDEPVSALDVSIQSQVLNLMKDLQDEFKLTYIFIAHDLSVVKHISTRVAVMYLGRIVEVATKKDLYEGKLHPYTEALISAVPSTDVTQKKQKITLTGELPSPANPPVGCAFHTRCPHVHDRCKQERPDLVEYKPEHFVACHLYTEKSE
ncbi:MULTISPECIES: ABC transporter ATP-binding protein [Shouchella]|uniref:Oligopeptide transport ATP-binding protein n=2 Tax=Bacillaceae TaxID=186817 RepID=A0A060LYX9_9BACI|nr:MULTISPECIES: dipeptide ABC transporter ATP-binding protein [Bacillaceae]AIC94975.1 oligopeptide transport ATP-binding protein [Shouchella lehensis G1]KQL58105.1 peptide ABC transporter substrate-binding protein [Alkalicoccobacillus plakortidis]